jgi:GLPGLI family protein
MYKISTAITLLVFVFFNTVIAQKSISEATIQYDINIQTLQSQQVANNLTGSTFIIYLKGGFSRTDMVSNLGNEKTIHDGKNGTAVILKEYSGQKLMITLSKGDWEKRVKKSTEINFDFTNDSKVIGGYNCNKATAKLNNGSMVTVYYTKDLQTINKEYSATFNNLPGLPIQYEFETTSMKFTYTLSKIDFNSIPSSKFEVPKTGYRVMNYEDAKSDKKDS